MAKINVCSNLLNSWSVNKPSIDINIHCMSELASEQGSNLLVVYQWTNLFILHKHSLHWGEGRRAPLVICINMWDVITLHPPSKHPLLLDQGQIKSCKMQIGLIHGVGCLIEQRDKIRKSIYPPSCSLNPP